jgi:hypothetical protein
VLAVGDLLYGFPQHRLRNAATLESIGARFGALRLPWPRRMFGLIASD